jgi:rhamnose utilization protein RhaD (predicted bifunctional aldolase and dehydrogenase)
MTNPELDSLKSLSAKLGRNRLLVQAAGGNTSVKQEGVMWVKASGTWLMHAVEKDIFVPVALAPLLKGLADGDPACESCKDFVRSDLNANALRPSIETTVHALMPQRVVLHVHCVETISWAVREDAESLLAPKLKDFRWRFIPYARPGLPLAHAIRDRIAADTDVLVLGNHGLAVAADTVEEAARLLAEVSKRLAANARPTAISDAEALDLASRGTPYRAPLDPQIHSLACDPVSRAFALRGTPYPDHAIFLGDGAGLWPTAAKLALVPGSGVLIHQAAPEAAADAMALCLADVLARLEPEAKLRILTNEDVDRLLNWDAEKYRQALASAGKA